MDPNGRSLNGRHEVVVVTGSSAGVGRAIAREFGKHGAPVGLLARGEDGLNAAVEEISRRPWPADTEIRVLTAEPPVDPVMLQGASLTVFEEFDRQERAKAFERLSDAVQTIRHGAPGLRVDYTLRAGRPKQVIIDEAEQWGADLIVLGAQGSGVLKRVFLGSVSLAVATAAPCSVEIVRRRHDAAPSAT